MHILTPQSSDRDISEIDIRTILCVIRGSSVNCNICKSTFSLSIVGMTGKYIR